MNSFEIKTDTTELEALARYFTSKDWIRVKKRAIGKAATKVRQNVVKALKLLLPASKVKNPKYTDRLIDAVKKSKTTNKGENVSTKVHIMGTRKKTSGTYRARFFEVGTKERKTKQGYSRGSIDPLHFFDKGMLESHNVAKDMNSIIEQEIIKLNNKKFK